MPNLTYSPNQGFGGGDSFTFKANDGSADSNTATVTIIVSAVNDAPVANAQSVSTNEDTAKSITLSASDADGDALVYMVVSQPDNGTLSGTAPNLTYTPNANYNGSDSFTFKANDGIDDSTVATVSITVVANQAPVANGQSASTNEDTGKSITLSASDAEGNALTYTVVSQPGNGTLSGTAPNLTYTPDANFNGSDSFTFRADDGKADSNTATVSITVTSVNDQPVANGQSTTVQENSLDNTITLSANDADGESLTYLLVSNPANGQLSGTPPNLKYDPNFNYNGSDSFTFKANDGKADSSIATVSITVNAVNDAPVADSQSVTTNEDTAKLITLLGTDADNDVLTYAVVSQPSNGTLSGTAPNLTYTPNAGFSGTDSFTFKANDGAGGAGPLGDSSMATVTITVTAVNDAPVANGQSVTTNEDMAKSIFLILSTSDAEGDALTYTVVGQPGNGTLSGTVPNLTYTPKSNYHGSDSFTFRANDGEADSNTATVSITVNSVNDQPDSWPLAGFDASR